MRDHHQPTGEPGHHLLQHSQPGQVQVIGRLVQQQHVGPDEQHHGQPQPGRLPTGQLPGTAGEDVHRKAEPAGDRVRPLGQVRRADREPGLQGGRVPGVRAGLAGHQRRRGPVQLGTRRATPVRRAR
jgi:hypothetical protein